VYIELVPIGDIDLTNYHRQAETQSMERLENKLGHVSHTLTDISRSIEISQLNTPKVLGYPWETDSSSSFVHLNDAIGRSIVLPAVLCRTVQTFQDTLKIMFSDHPGFGDVNTGQYEIINETDGRTLFHGHRTSTLTRRNWEPLIPTKIDPGSKLKMSILKVKVVPTPQKALVASVQRDERCPACEFLTSGRAFWTWLVPLN
jgi:hypothetical protein